MEAPGERFSLIQNRIIKKAYFRLGGASGVWKETDGGRKNITENWKSYFFLNYPSIIGEFKEIKAVNPKGNQPEYSLKGLMLKLELQYFGHLIEKGPDAGKD